MVAQYKLVYFNTRARAEPIRLIFAAADQKYEDHRFEKEQWPEYKAKSPFGQAPWLEIHDAGNVTVLSQSITILRYLARKFGLAGKNDLEAAEIEMYGDQITDFFNEFVAIFLEKDDTRKKTLQEKYANETVPHNMKLFNERLGKTGSGYFAASGLSWVDLYLFNVLEYLGDKRDVLFANFKNVKALDDKIRANPRIAAWLANRPKTEY